MHLYVIGIYWHEIQITPPETTMMSDLATQPITTNEQTTKYMGRNRGSTKLPDTKLTYIL